MKPELLRDGVVTAAFLALAGFYGSWGWSTVLADFGGDNAVYWLTANYWSPWSSPLAPAAYFATTSVYPPLYPLVLAGLGGGESLLVAHLLSAGFVVLALAAIYRFSLGLGLGWPWALALVALFAGSRITLVEALQIHSEHLYLVFTYTALGLAQARSDDRRALCLAAVCVTAAYFTRTFGLTLAVSFLTWLAIVRSRALPACAAIIGIPVVLWSSLHGGSSHYLDQFARIYVRGDVAPTLLHNLNVLRVKWLFCFGETGQPGFTAYGPAAVALICLGGTLLRARAGALDGIYALVYVILVIIWPYPAEYERLLYPALPLLFAQGVLAARFIARSFVPAMRPGAAAAAFAMLLFATELPFAILAGSRLADVPRDPGFAPYTRSLAWFYADIGTAIANIGYQRGVTEALADIHAGDRVPAGACMLAIKPSIVALYSGREAQGPPSADLSGQAIIRQLRESRCGYLFMMQSASPSFPEPYYPYSRVSDALEIIAVYANPVVDGTPAAMLGRAAPASYGDSGDPALH